MDCMETLQVSVAEYEAIRSSPVRFPVKPGHTYSEFERVVEEREGYVIVEKFGEAGKVARHLDPRQRA
jgi:5-bromo-4-chloroindolyl phosphate hydrolysis protein